MILPFKDIYLMKMESKTKKKTKQNKLPKENTREALLTLWPLKQTPRFWQKIILVWYKFNFCLQIENTSQTWENFDLHFVLVCSAYSLKKGNGPYIDFEYCTETHKNPRRYPDMRDILGSAFFFLLFPSRLAHFCASLIKYSSLCLL